MAHDEPGGGVPESYRIAAEEVRAHLVCLRGGAPFLSPSDALQLVQWFDRGVTVGEILRALDRAHAARRSARSRLPFGLGQAKRHLGRPTATRLPVAAQPVPASPEEGPLAPLVAALRRQAVGDREQAALVDLATAIASIPPGDPDALVRATLALVRAFRTELWERRSADEREEARAAARSALGEVLSQVDEATGESLVEEEAREVVWSPYRWLDAATVWDLVERA